MDIRDITYQILKDELFHDKEKNVFHVNEKLIDCVYSDMEDYPIIKDKVLKIVEKMNNMNDDELLKFINADFQEEIWDKI